MGIIRDIFRGEPNSLIAAAATEPVAPSFSVDANSIDPAVFGLTSYASPTAVAPRIDRRAAMQAGAVKRSRDLVPGTLGTLPLDLYGPNNARANSALLEQPERNLARSVSMTRLFEDMYFEGIGWWLITEIGWHGYPTKVRRLKPSRVAVDDDGLVYVDGILTSDRHLIRFDSPTDPFLVAGARAIRTFLVLDAAVARNADGVPPLDYFSSADGFDPADDLEVQEILDAWQTARKSRATGYVPANLKHNVVGWNPEELQLEGARREAVIEIARHGGVDPEELGVSTTSRTYANSFDRRKTFLDFTLGQFRQAVEDRLSMPDVTPRGYYSKFNLDSFLRSSTLERYQAYAAGLACGALDQSEIRDLEDKPPLANPPAPTKGPPAVAASQPTAIGFDDEPVIRLDAPQAGAAFQVDVQTRTISGLAVPYGVQAMSNGQRWQFAQGTIKFADVRRVKLWVQHDKTQAVGVATALDDRPEGLFATFKVARGPEGDKALSLAEDGVLDGLSIGLKQGGKFATRGGVNFAVEAPLMEISLTPAPSFDDARVHAVAASADQEGNIMPCTKCNQIHGAGIVECDATALASFEASQSGADFSAISDAISQGFQAINVNIGAPEPVGAGESFAVTEALPYRFDGTEGEHSFSADLRATASGDTVARQRLDGFMDEAFAVTSAGVSSLNPTQHRPELYVPNLEFTRPLFNMISTGPISDKTPFTVPKFASAAGLVGDHTEGTEPTPGSFTATEQTISPTAVSGKIEINREVWDQGGSPQADAIIWREMLSGYYEALETKIAAMLNGLTLTEVNLAGATDDALVDAVENIFVDLQFVRGGNRYSGMALDGQLFKALVGAKGTDGRKLLPALAPQNADGQTAGNFSEVAIGSQRAVASWALGSAVDSNSYLVVPSSVWLWASPPKRFTFEYQVKSVDMAIWGYQAGAVLRDTDVKRIDYTTADV